MYILALEPAAFLALILELKSGVYLGSISAALSGNRAYRLFCLNLNTTCNRLYQNDICDLLQPKWHLREGF